MRRLCGIKRVGVRGGRDPVTDDEFTEMMEGVPKNSNDEINYVDYAHTMLSS